MQESTRPGRNQFALDVERGLASDPKFLSSKYFYDDEGSRLFQEIMKLPEYYLTRSEIEIFTEQSADIFSEFDHDGEEFDLIELGAGDGTKTALLVEHLLGAGASFGFVPIDISAEAIGILTSDFEERFPAIDIRPEVGDYFAALETFASEGARPKLVLFLGSNIGNFREDQALAFFRSLRRVLLTGDRLLIGFDLHKNPQTILNAYDDSLGVTRRFNLNLLRRINRELDADFNLEEFTHYAAYHPLERAARSFLVSQKEQVVRVGALNRSFHFERWEPIFMEISQKYDLRMIEGLARSSGFEVVRNFFDSNGFYCDSMWRPVSQPGDDPVT